jgi:hypothetical protein
VTLAKKNPPHVAIRSINRVVTDKNACRKIMEVLKERYASRPSGMTRITPVGARLGDNAAIVDITLVDAELGGEKDKGDPKAAKRKKKKEAEDSKEAKEAKEKKSSASSDSSASSASSKKVTKIKA